MWTFVVSIVLFCSGGDHEKFPNHAPGVCSGGVLHYYWCFFQRSKFRRESRLECCKQCPSVAGGDYTDTAGVLLLPCM